MCLNMFTVLKIKYETMNGAISYCVIWDRPDPLYFTKDWLKLDRMYEAATEPCLKNPKCDWIWENQSSTHNYKYLEIPILIIWGTIICNSGREADICMKFATIL